MACKYYAGSELQVQKQHQNKRKRLGGAFLHPRILSYPSANEIPLARSKKPRTPGRGLVLGSRKSDTCIPGLAAECIRREAARGGYSESPFAGVCFNRTGSNSTDATRWCSSADDREIYLREFRLRRCFTSWFAQFPVDYTPYVRLEWQYSSTYDNMGVRGRQGGGREGRYHHVSLNGAVPLPSPAHLFRSLPIIMILPLCPGWCDTHHQCG
ncbi:hypothetical protein F4774DRAFT_216802 [Daldinia eschscholtzii]|nr:hypothetical protein F4774DRAFT_216802 [Daldinia eschscholtzii]